MMKFNPKKVWLIILSLLFCVTFAVTALADVGFDGASGNGSSGSTGSDWNVPSGNNEQTAIVGYRFTIVDRSVGAAG